jgi:hypothetical protein
MPMPVSFWIPALVRKARKLAMSPAAPPWVAM